MGSDDEHGSTAVEYALLLVAIVLVLASVVLAFGSVVRNAFDDECSAVDHSQAQACSTGGAP